MSTTSTQSPLFIWPKIQLAHGTIKAAPLACHGTWPMCCLPQPRGLQEVRLRSGMVLQPSLPEARLGTFRGTSPGSPAPTSIQRHLQSPQRPQQSARGHSVLHHQGSSQESSVNMINLSGGSICMTFEGGRRTSCVGALMAHMDYLMILPCAPA